MTTILNSLIGISQERRARYQTTIKRELPDPYGFNEIIYLGSYSFFFPQSSKRILTSRNLIPLEPGLMETPPSIARAYLETVYKHGPRVRHDQIMKIKSDILPMPNMARPCKFDHGFYIDIKSAFWSIMNIIGWNPDYNPGVWLAPGRAPFDFPFPEHKVARNCLVSAGLITEIPVYLPPGKSGGVKSIGSKLLNYSLYRLIGDVLNTIAAQAESLGAVYANCDGYIAPNPAAAVKITQLIFDWGLTPRVKAEGEGGVRGAGAYKVGAFDSMPWATRKRPREVRAIHPRKYSKWLRDRMSYFAAEGSHDNH